jgi:amino acid transporter
MALVYAFFSAAIPRSGGDYVYISRTLHPLLGFVAS